MAITSYAEHGPLPRYYSSKNVPAFIVPPKISNWLAKQFICVTNTTQLTILIILLGSWWISYFFIPKHSRVHSNSVLARQLFSFFLQQQHTINCLFDQWGQVLLSVVVSSSFCILFTLQKCWKFFGLTKKELKKIKFVLLVTWSDFGEWVGLRTFLHLNLHICIHCY